MFLGLGDADEYAHAGDLPGYLASVRASDQTLAELFDLLDRSGAWGARTVVLVTSDHGRGSDWRDHGVDPQSSRVWLAALGRPVTARGAVASRRERHLADVAPTVRSLLALPADAAPSAGTPLVELFDPSPLPRRRARPSGSARQPPVAPDARLQGSTANAA